MLQPPRLESRGGERIEGAGRSRLRPTGADVEATRGSPACIARANGEWENLYGIWMNTNGMDGVALGTRGIWYTENGGHCWEPAAVYKSNGQGGWTLLGPSDYATERIRLWGLDALAGTDHQPCGDTATYDFLGLAVGQPGHIYRSVDWGRTWYREYDVNEDPPTMSCMILPVPPSQSGEHFRLWDVAIRKNATGLEAVAVGGVATGCGWIVSSSNGGCGWTQQFHECSPEGDLDCVDLMDYEPHLAECSVPNSPCPHRHQDLKTLYGVGFFDGTGVVVAAGYNGQHLVREAGQTVWRDRSSYRQPPNFDVLTSTVAPLWHVAVAQGTNRAFISGLGGHVRVTDDAGQTWDHELLGEPFRTHAAYFREVHGFPDRGWMVGQGNRIAWSEDGGLTWDDFLNPFTLPGCSLYDITFAGDLDTGVTVGCSTSQPGDGPKIFYTSEFEGPWTPVDPDDVHYHDDSPTGGPEGPDGIAFRQSGFLRRVVWSGDTSDQEFWAVGKQGLALRSVNGGQVWNQVVPDVANYRSFDIRAVAAMGGTHAIFVGSQGGVGVALVLDSSQSTWTWTSVSIPSGVHVLLDVAVTGSQAYAVGQRHVPGGMVEGVVLEYVQATPPEFQLVPGPFDPDGVPECNDGADPLLDEGLKTLLRVAVDPGGNLWIAGLCGRAWEQPASSSTWVQHKTQSGASIVSMQFLSDIRAYFMGYSGNQISHVLVRLSR